MKNIILIGMKACGKTTIGKILAQKLSISFIELDDEIEKKYLSIKKEKLSFKEIYSKYGKKYFRNLETDTLLEISKIAKEKDFVLACGGGTPLKNINKKILKRLGKNIFLDVNREVLLERILKNDIPSFFPFPDNPKKSLDELLKKRLPVYRELAEFTLTIDKETPEEIVNKLSKNL